MTTSEDSHVPLPSSPPPIPVITMPWTILTHLPVVALGKVHNHYAVVQNLCLLEEADHLRQVSNLSIQGTAAELGVHHSLLVLKKRICSVCNPTPGQKILLTLLDPMGSSIPFRRSCSCGSFLGTSRGLASGTCSCQISTYPSWILTCIQVGNRTYQVTIISCVPFPY
jgi:hypothetical protein